MIYQTETFHRGEKLGSKPHLMPALTYNTMLTLFQRCGESCLFIPIRSMQYMAVIDDEEVIFVDSQRKAVVEFSWQKFHPQSRDDLSGPVPYEFVYYDSQALETIVRAKGEFALCIHQMMQKRQKQRIKNPAHRTVLSFPANETQS